MAWAKTMASRMTCVFFRVRFEDNPHALLFGDVKIKHMNFFPLEGSEGIREKKAILVAGELIKFMDSLSIELENEGDRTKLFEGLMGVLVDGEKDSSEIVSEIDKHYKFSDEK